MLHKGGNCTMNLGDLSVTTHKMHLCGFTKILVKITPFKNRVKMGMFGSYFLSNGQII